MLSQHIQSAFDGVNSESINWMKHYLNGGDDVGAAWNGIADSVSGYTFKYSNQFEFDIKKSDLVGSNLRGLAYAFKTGKETGLHYIKPAIKFTSEVISPDGEFDLTFCRLPYPDLPGVLFVKGLGGNFRITIMTTYADGSGQTSEFTNSGIAIPIEDPNWTPDSINLVKDPTRVYYSSALDTGSYMRPKCAVDVEPGFSKDITAYRMAGASLTFNCTAPAITKNGTIVAVGATTPYKYGNDFDFNVKDGTGLTTSGENNNFNYYAQDLPIGYNTISSVKSYHKFRMNEGVYVVLHNTQGVYLFNNIEDNHQVFTNGFGPIADDETNVVMPCIKVYSNGVSTTYPLVVLKNKSVYDRYVETKIPRYFIPDTPITEWNTCCVSPTQTNSDDTLIYTCKFNTYCECYVSSFSRLKPSVSMTSMYYPRLLEYLSGFYHKYDGIYPSSWNDGNHIWELFKRFLSSGALSAAVSAVNPTAGRIVPILQSIAQRYFNRLSSTGDKKLSKKQKQQARVVAKDDSTLFGRNKDLAVGKPLNPNAKPFYPKKK